MPVLVHLKVFQDGTAAATGQNAKRFVITDDLGGSYLRSIHATVTEAGTDDTEINLRNLTTSLWLLNTVTTIDAGDTTSYTSATPHELDTFDYPPKPHYMSRGDVLRIDIDAGSDATGLEVLLEFGAERILLTP